ncbi:MAG: GH92 family glycosyl hydrolase [bacterium]|nr:GH92 family glycosyl hydrolase [bacterium]
MKNLYKVASVLVALLVAVGLATSSCSRQETCNDYTQYVNVFIGTGGHGHTYPGAVVPHGAIQPSPDTRIYGWDACSGYYYNDSTINGFSHTHLSGTGCCDLGDVLIMPTVGEQDITQEEERGQTKAYASAFSHEREKAEPGYYSVMLDRYGIQAEITSTTRGAIHRWTFPKSEDAGVIVDLDYSLDDQTNIGMQLEVISDTEVVGHKMTKYWAFDQYINFYAKFSKPFTYTIVDDTVTVGDKQKPRRKALLKFAGTEEGEVIYAKVGVSAVDIDGAKNNVLSEIPEWDFDGVKAAAHQRWSEYLAKIDIETGDADHRAIFYTALYHAGLQPYTFTDADGRYYGMDMKVHQGDAEKPVYTIFSTWDTFRAWHPLQTIIAPEFNGELVKSLLLKAREGGILPMWELCSNYTGCMIGYHSVPIIADAYIKGYRDIDINEAYKAMRRTAEYDTTGIIAPKAVAAILMNQAKYWKNKVGYVPCDKDNEAVAKALEFAYNDWCIAQIAKEVGDTAGVALYENFAKAYKIYYDPEVGYMRGKDSEGKWRTPFDPARSTHRSDDYCEGNAWQWSWFVPHDPEGLMDLVGGKDVFLSKLDALFAASSEITGESVSADISGLIGQYAHGNEPSHHIIHFYNYAGQPWKTQELVDQVLYTLYFNNDNGLSGNEDCGQMSAWYILNAMGFYQVCPGKPVYSIGRPLYDKVTINLTNGKKFVIEAINNSRENKYIQSMELNGKALTEPFFTHDDIMQGGKLVFTMGNTPKK